MVKSISIAAIDQDGRLLKDLRAQKKMNQEDFWRLIGITQSGGSRYESGRKMPRAVRQLLRVVHIEGIDLSKVKAVDFALIEYVKEQHPDLYKSLKKAVKDKAAAEAAESQVGA